MRTGCLYLLNNDINIEYAKVEIQNRKTGFGSNKKPVFGFAKIAGFPGFSVSVKTGLQSLYYTLTDQKCHMSHAISLPNTCQYVGSRLQSFQAKPTVYFHMFKKSFLKN
jgi:hypothetical protein